MNWYNVLKGETRKQLESNWTAQQERKGTRQEEDYEPVCKLFLPWAAATWLLTELEPTSSLAFGLCDLGFGTPELGYVDLEEVYSVEGPGGLRVEQDIHFEARKTLSEYASEANRMGCIIA